MLNFLMSLKPQHYYADGWQTERTFSVTNPATGETFAQVADCDADDAAQAAETAWRSFQTWSQTTAFERSDILLRWHDLIMAKQEDLAQIMTAEMGKPIRESRGEIAYAAGFVRWYAEEAKRVYGETLPSHVPHKRLMVIKQAVGPVYAVTPWNFPSAMVTRKAAPALAAGCTFVLKPAEQTPLSALHLAALWEEAGGPAGTLQVLPCQDPVPVSETLLADTRIRKLTFTGSTEVGRILYKQSAATIKKMSLELGGHAPFIVFEDADIDQAVTEVMKSKFRNTGQTCVCANRIYVQDSILETFSKAYAKAAAALKVGDPTKDDTDLGPLVDEQGLQKVKAHVSDALEKGASLLTGGQALDGLYFEPTVLTGITDDMQLMSEETFGPVAPLISFKTEEEALERANGVPYGLAAYFYTQNLSRAYRVAERLEYGIIGVNDGLPSAPYIPFGGVKQSGLGREGGHWGLDEYLETKLVSLGLG